MRGLAILTTIAVLASSSAFPAGDKSKQPSPDECPQSVCVTNGLRQGHANAETWCKANRKTKLVGPTCAYR